MVYLVVRAPQAGPLGKRVVELDAPSVLGWFQRAWGESLRTDPGAYVRQTLGSVYGLSSVFQAAREHRLPPPQTFEELAALLRTWLYTEGEVRVEDGSVRVLTDDDEVSIAYAFVDAETAQARPERFRYLLHSPWALPDGASDGPWSPPEIPTVSLSPGTGAGETCAVLLNFTDWGLSVHPARTFRFPGVRLPDLAAHLCAASPQRWPHELRILRGLLDPASPKLEAGLRDATRFPVEAFGAQAPLSLGEGPQPDARAAILAAARGLPVTGQPELCRVRCRPHVAQLCLHVDAVLGYQQWFFFDDRWAAAHPELARSLLWYSHSWDPLAPRQRVESPAPQQALSGAPGPRRHPLLGRSLPAIDREAKELLSVAAGFAELRCQQVHTLRVAAQEVAQQPWTEGPLDLPAPAASIRSTDVIRALLATVPQLFASARPELDPRFDEICDRAARAAAALPTGRRPLSLSMALHRRWAMSGRDGVEGLLAALGPELQFLLAHQLSMFQGGMLVAEEAMERALALLPVPPAPPVPSAYIDWAGGLSALRSAPPGPLWLIGRAGCGRRRLLAESGWDGEVRLFEAEAAARIAQAQDGARASWLTIPAVPDDTLLSVLAAHHPVIEDTWRVPWGLPQTMAVLVALAVPLHQPVGALLAAMHGCASAQACLPPDLLAARSDGSAQALMAAHPREAQDGRGLVRHRSPLPALVRQWQRWLLPASGSIDARRLRRGLSWSALLPDVAAARQLTEDEAALMAPGAGVGRYIPR